MNLNEERWPPRGMRAGELFQWSTGNAFSVVGVDLGRRRDHTGIVVVEERRVQGERRFWQEYRCEFVEAEDGVFGYEDLMAMIDHTVEPFEPPAADG